MRLTKNELKKQREDLQRFQRYLPMLQLRQQQLQSRINKVRRTREEISQTIDSFKKEIFIWVDLFAEEINFEEFISLREVITTTGNIAGVDIPVFERVDFEEKPYDFLNTPFWLDAGIEAVKRMTELNARMAVLKREEEILKEELRIATQRVNLFEKVKIPEAQENIRIISIYLGDQQTASVIRGKIAKAKMEKRR